MLQFNIFLKVFSKKKKNRDACRVSYSGRDLSPA
jgi:hypothetical protein